MNLDTKSTVTNAVYSSNEMKKNANTTQVKRYTDANTSFATEMKNSSEQQENNEIIDETVEKTALKTENKEETQKTENKHSDKVNPEKQTNNDTVQGEVSSDNQFQNGEFHQNQSQNNNQSNNYTPLTSQIQAYMSANGLDMNFASINPMNATNHSQLTGMATTVDYTTVQMSDTDAKFFADLVARQRPE